MATRDRDAAVMTTDPLDRSPTARAHRYDRDHARRLRALAYRMLRSAAAQRERYVGVWLPEPLLEDDELFQWAPSPEKQAEFAEDVSVAFMLALERLSPLERAAFLLHDVFDLDYDEIARHLGRSE